MTAHLRKHRERLESRPTAVSPLPLLPAFLADHLPDAGNMAGRGIVTSAGPAYQGSAYVLFRLLRHVGCNLPIECWYLGEAERDDSFADLVAPLGVTMVDALAKGFEPITERPSFEADRSGKHGSYTPTAVNGYALKPFAILHSSFREVLWLDADNCPAADPARLFDSAEYQQAGALFWPDQPHRRLSTKTCQAFGVEWRDEREFETGQIVLDKARCREALLTTWFLNLHRAWSYRFSWGDKDTFQVGWWKAAAEYFLAANAGGGSGVFVQHDPAGKPLFWHRSMGTRYSIDGKNQSAGFPLHDVAMQALEHYRHFQGVTRERAAFSPANTSERNENWNESCRGIKRQIRIAAYDRPHYLRETLAHLKRCRGLDSFQIVASVDARPDGTHNAEVVALCRQVTSDVRLRSRLGCNRHTHVNLQEGASEADWLFLLEDDIIVSREALEWCLENEEALMADAPNIARRSRGDKTSLSSRHPNSMCLIGQQAENATDRRDELAVWDYFCAWGMYFSPAGLRRALEVWQPEWDDRPRQTWDCYLTDAGWSQLMPHVPRAKNIGRIGEHCRSEQDFSDADRQHWVDDLPRTVCCFINGPDRKEYQIRHALPSHLTAFDRVIVIDKTGSAWPAGVEVIRVPANGDFAAAYQAMIDATAVGDWIGWLDADECYGAGTLDFVRRKDFDADCDGYEVYGFDRNYEPITGQVTEGINLGWVKRNLVKRRDDTRPDVMRSTHCSLSAGPKIKRLPASCWYYHQKSRPECLYGWLAHGLVWPDAQSIDLLPALLAAVEAFRQRWGITEVRANELLQGDDAAFWADLRTLSGFDHPWSAAVAEYCDVYGHQRTRYPLLAADLVGPGCEPWPAERPPLEFDPFGWLVPENKPILAEYCRRASLVLEIGSYLGLSTRWILDNSQAEVIAVDTWLGSIEHYSLPECQQYRGDRLFEQFITNQWDYRGRLTIVRNTASTALRYLASRGIKPAVIYLDASHDADDVALDVKLCRQLFPNAVIVGDDWGWDSVRAGIAAAGVVPTWTQGNCWVLEPQ